MGNIINKAMKIGNSLMIIIPSNIVNIYKVKKGDILELDLEKNHRDQVKNE